MKDENVEKLKAQIDKWSADIDRLEADVNDVKVDAQVRYKASLEALKARRDLAVQKSKELTTASEDSFDAIKQGFVAAWRDLGKGMESAKNAFRDMM